MNVSLTPELEQYVNDKVATGLYTSASEVVREGLRLLFEREQAAALRLDELRRRVAVGLQQLDRGEGVDGEQAFERLRQRGRQRRRG